jgi:catechol 2,3-dioxygenase-like lactoylglutathione lyase family enzyme
MCRRHVRQGNEEDWMEGRISDPLRRKGSTAVHSLHRFVFSVPDLMAAVDFYRAFGLEVREVEGRADLHTMGHPHRWASIYQRPGPKQLEYVSFGIYADDLDALVKRFTQTGVATTPPHTLADEQGIWIRDPEGTPVQIVIGPKVTPATKSVASVPVVVPGRGAAPSRSTAGVVHPRRLSHILLFSSDVLRSVRFYTKTLGLRLSDRSGEEIAFLHGAHASDHHLVAFVKSDGPGLHHSSWDVASIDDVGIGMQQMADRGHVDGWGLGRHVIGSNYFRYVRDPWGSFAEYSHGIDFIAADMEWNAGDYPAEDSFYVWGPAPPDDFVTNHETASRQKNA